MIITIDGPVACGKSTVSLALANRLSFFYLATGLMYRFIAYHLIYREKIKEQDLAHVPAQKIFDLLNSGAFEYTYAPLYGAQIFYKQENYTPFLKMAGVDKYASILGSVHQVRQEVVAYQKKLAESHNLVVEGRDAGTVVFPQADFKFFLTASDEVRARRWQKDQMRLSNLFTLDESLKITRERDDRDKNRAHSPLKMAEDAVLIDNSTLTLGQTIDAIYEVIAPHVPKKDEQAK
ncbi:MAG: Cytidylate kinase [candidate division TM6 bacterium GW2011_GWE2_41_16]|nr:MAG: Cytidylate kinase [candidate division TM6 bacterium GW2011_GWE2_41_16]